LAKGFFQRVLSLVGLETEEGEDIHAGDDSVVIEEEDDPEIGQVQEGGRRRGSVVPLAPAKAMRVVVVEPAAFDEVQAIALNLRNRRPVIVNLEQTDREIARRIVDFLSGATYALGGSMQRVGGAIFLFAPHNVDVAAQSPSPEGSEGGGAIWSPK